MTTPLLHRGPGSSELTCKACAELLGSLLLAATVVGTGIAAQQLSPRDTGLQLLENSLITGGALAFGAVLVLYPDASQVADDIAHPAPARHQLRNCPEEPPMSKPVILYACIHNSGRSLAGKVLTEHYANGAVEVRSAGSEPGDSLNPVVVEVLHERGLSTDGEAPKLLTCGGVVESDVVITMGCGEACPYVPGKRIIDWQLDDPKGQDLPTVRRIVHEIDSRVRSLLAEFGVAVLTV